jgi:6-phosphogluconolactonase
MGHVHVEVVTDPAALAGAAAGRVAAAARESVEARGRFVFVLSGGSTPRRLYETLATAEWKPRIPWDRAVILFGDERCVPPDHPQSNYRMARETLLDRLPLQPGQVHRMRGEASDPSHAARAYEAELRGLFPGESGPRFDLLLLGMGPDGHTASLFLGTQALQETTRWVVANHVPKLDAWRLTLTLPALRAARRTLFLISDGDKAKVLAEAFGGAPHDTPHPAELAVPADGITEVLADADFPILRS